LDLITTISTLTFILNPNNSEPTYNNVAEKIYNRHDDLIVSRIDCTKYGKICEEYWIDSYPTIMFVNANTRVKYTGDRSEDAMVKFAERLNGPNINFVRNCDEMASAITKNEMIILSTIEKNHTLVLDFESIAQSHKSNYWFYKFISSPPERCEKGEISFALEEETIYIMKTNLNKAIKFKADEKLSALKEGSKSEDIILEWIHNNSLPVYTHISGRNIERVLATGRLLVLAILDEHRPSRRLSSSSLAFHKAFEQLAIKLTRTDEQLLFGWLSDSDLIEYITLNSLKTKPNIMVLNQDFGYSLMIKDALEKEDSGRERTSDSTYPSQLNEQNLIAMISKAKSGELEFAGGNSYVHVLMRHSIGNINKFLGMYRANPLLVSLLFGFPGAILIFVIYTTCFYGDDVDEDQGMQPQTMDSDGEDDDSEFEERAESRPLIGSRLKQD